MTQLLAVDGVAYRLLNGWVSLVRAGAVWLVFSLPLVTGPAATVVLLDTVGRLRDGRRVPGFAESWRCLRAGFWPALRLAVLVGAGHGVVVAATLGPSPGGVWDSVLPLVVVPVAVTWILATQWVFTALVERSGGELWALRRSYMRAMRRPDLALASVLGTAILAVVGVLLPSTVAIPYWLTVPALWALLVTVTDQRAAGHGRRMATPGCPLLSEEKESDEDQKDRGRQCGSARRHLPCRVWWR